MPTAIPIKTNQELQDTLEVLYQQGYRPWHKPDTPFKRHTRLIEKHIDWNYKNTPCITLTTVQGDTGISWAESLEFCKNNKYNII